MTTSHLTSTHARTDHRATIASCVTLCSTRSAAFTLIALAAACSAPSGPIPNEPYGQVQQASGGTLTWKGYQWIVTNGGMAGIANGDPNNVSVDASGYLHLKLTKTGTTWTAAELYSATNLGFGTYQWQISGPIDRMDHTVVLGLSPYGPAAGVGTDGFNEIDTEFSYWNDELTHVNMDWGVYPATSNGKHDEDDTFFSLDGGTSTTARMVWSSAGTVSTVMSGFVPLGATTNTLNSYSYMPADSTDNIPQQPLPVLINLWIYEAVPSSGNDLEIVLQDFQFIPEGQPIPDAGSGNADDAGATDAGTSGDTGSSDAGNATADASGPSTNGGDSGGSLSASDAGAPGQMGSSDDGGASPPDGSSGSSPAGSSGGCNAGRAPAPAGGAAVFGLGLFLATIAARRRRRTVP